MRNRTDMRLPSPALILACVSLIVSLGGVSYAATVLPANSVSTKQLRKAAVTAAKLRPGAVTPSKIDPKSVALFKGQQGPAGVPGPVGPKGDPGVKGDPGAQGSPGLSEIETRVLVRENVADGAEERGKVECPAGKVAVGGGVMMAGGPPGASIVQTSGPLRILFDAAGNPVGDSLPADREQAQGWVFGMVNHSGDTRRIIASVICAKPSGPSA